VNTAPEDSEAGAVAGVSDPLAQESDTVTDPPAFGWKSLLTVKLAVFSVLTIVQEPVKSGAVHVPLEEYPAGIGDSVAVQDGFPTKPVTVNTPGDDSDTEAVAGVSVPLAHASDTVTLAALLSLKSLLTVKLAVFSVLTIVQDPVIRGAEQVPLDVYPAGIGDSVAVHDGLPVNPVTVNAAGVDSDAEADAGLADPVAQTRETVTEAALLGTKSLLTVKLALFSVLTIVQDPAARAAEHVPLDEYPVGIGDSVAVQDGLPTKPVTVNTAGRASEADADEGAAVPDAHDRETVTLEPILGWKSLLTVKFAVLRVFTIVQLLTLPSLMPTLTQAELFVV